MGQGLAIFNLAVGFVILAALIMLLILPCLLLSWKMLKEFWQWVKEKWSNISAWHQPIYIIACSIAFAIIFVSAYNGYYYFTSDVLPKKFHLYEEALSNIRRNTMLFIFAIVGICLAIWARSANERQLEYTRKQLENSAEINRNDRFAKAVELVDDKRGIIATRGGLYMLQDLVYENPKSEYIRCVDIVCHWLLENKKAHISLLNTATEIFKIKISNAEWDEIMEAKGIIDKNGKARVPWPNLRKANLQKANLEGAYLQGANLVEADLQQAVLKRANLKGAYLGNAELQKANLRDARLQDAKLQGVKLQGANLARAKFQEASLQRAKLQNAFLGYANFEKTNLKAANLENANLLCAEIESAINLEKKQILSAYWSTDHIVEEYEYRDEMTRTSRKYYMSGESPQLPDNLMNDSELKEWLDNPDNERFEEAFVKQVAANIASAKKTPIKKIIAKKAVAKKVKAKVKKATAKKSKAKKAKAKKPQN